MEKAIADKIISEYIQKIYGFALSKTHKLDEAEDLASQITLDVYTSLLKYNQIENINGYVYRVSANVYARFVDKSKKGIHLSLDEVIDYSPIDYYDFVNDIIESESYQLLRREIKYLSDTQRKIIVRHYFENKKVSEIAKELKIPEGTVKWHLHDAKNNMKEGMKKMRGKGTLGINPIEFSSMGHSGRPGKLGDTSYFLRSSLNQNIAYAAYHEPKTINEIAEELGVAPVFIQGEVDYLVEYGFIDKIGSDRYLTNICIDEITKEIQIKQHELAMKYADIVKEKYIPLLIPFVENLMKDEKLYVPDNDINLLMWAVITYALTDKFYVSSKNIDLSRYYVKRPDGGEYMAFASVDLMSDDDMGIDNSKYRVCGGMTRFSEKYPEIYSWQICTYYDDRKKQADDNTSEDYEYMYEVCTGKIQKDEASADKYKRLYDKGYLIGDKVNIITYNDVYDSIYKSLPDVSDELKKVNDEYSDELYAMIKEFYPKHMQDLKRSNCANPLSGIKLSMRVIEMLVADGMLQLPTDDQKHGMNTIMYKM